MFYRFAEYKIYVQTSLGSTSLCPGYAAYMFKNNVVECKAVSVMIKSNNRIEKIVKT